MVAGPWDARYLRKSSAKGCAGSWRPVTHWSTSTKSWATSLAVVVREDDSPIQGLYAQGNTASNIFGEVYPGAGPTIGQGLVYGTIIADDGAQRSREAKNSSSSIAS
ncbi:MULTISPECIES: FAD-binding protein [Glutamicibacter]|uniref:FAD-binding protein n=1 Tax=Glutamicibacter TaxID=1742989 RepID=UPI0005A2F3F6|nr:MULTISPECIES: FAD-binding protein [Glutamicibacter]HCH47003.1 FAD binding domain-containing protein [Glutamicibacter sp.]